MSMRRYTCRNIKASHGFSLIELMVSVTVFAIVMVVSTTTLLTMINANAKAQALYSATTNLSFALDSMTREIRTGYHYYCKDIAASGLNPGDPLPTEGNVRDCIAIPGNSIAFNRERDDGHMGYRLNAGRLEEKDESANWVPLTSKDVFIDTFTLVVQNTDQYESTGDMKQPVVDLTVIGHVNNGLETNTDFHIQTHIVERRLDLL